MPSLKELINPLVEGYKEFSEGYTKSGAKGWVRLGADVSIILLAYWVFSNYGDVRYMVQCRYWQPVIDAAQACPYGVRGDLCAIPLDKLKPIEMNSTNPFYIFGLNGSEANLTPLFYPAKPKVEKAWNNNS